MKCVKIHHERLAWPTIFSVTVLLFVSLGFMGSAHALENDQTGKSISEERKARIRQA
jgi:hypothetical protein